MTPTTRREKPVFRHALVMGSLAAAIIMCLSMKHSWDMVASASYYFLKYAGVDVSYYPYGMGPLTLINMRSMTGDLAPILVRLPDGRVAQFYVLIECSGIITLGVFAVISTITVGLLRGSLPAKLGWLLLSMGVGFLWNINRVTLAMFTAYNFGLEAFSLVHYLLAPFVDFVWIVSMWALGMSLLRRGRER